MTEPARRLPQTDDATAEAEALARAVAEARAGARGVPHAELRQWLLKVAEGDPEAPVPEARPL